MNTPKRIHTTQFEVRVPTHNGPHTVHATVTRGWGEAIDGWALRMNGSRVLGQLYLHLGFDETSRTFKDLYRDALEEDNEPSLNYFMKLSNGSFVADKAPLPRLTEQVGAKIVLKHLMSLPSGEQSPFYVPSVTRLFTVIAESHTHSLQANEFLDVQNKPMNRLAISA